MIYHDLSHASEEWFAARIGVATASMFDKIITPTGKASAQMGDYADHLIAELIMQQSLEKFPQNYWMERGALLEDEARRSYQTITDLTLDRGGFMTTDDGRIGCSPDVRVMDGERVVGAAEIKCPAPWTHVSNLLRDGEEIDPKYIPQVQGQMFVSGLEWIDWFSYHPDMPPALIRTKRDDDYQERMRLAFDTFLTLMNIKIVNLAKKGVTVPLPQVKAKPLSEPLIMAG